MKLDKKAKFMGNMKQQLVDRLGPPPLNKKGMYTWGLTTDKGTKAILTLSKNGILVTISGDGPEGQDSVTFTPVFGNLNILFQLFNKVLVNKDEN